MSLDSGLSNLAGWAGNVMIPTMAGLFFAGAVYRYSKGPHGHGHEPLLYGGFLSLMCAGLMRALEGFVQNTGPANNPDAYWQVVLSLVNYVGNVILPVFALTQFGAMVMHMGGVLEEVYPGSMWIRKFIAGVGALMVSGILRFAESMVSQAHGI